MPVIELVSFSLSSGPYIFPPSRIIAGIDDDVVRCTQVVAAPAGVNHRQLPVGLIAGVNVLFDLVACRARQHLNFLANAADAVVRIRAEKLERLTVAR